MECSKCQGVLIHTGSVVRCEKCWDVEVVKPIVCCVCHLPIKVGKGVCTATDGEDIRAVYHPSCEPLLHIANIPCDKDCHNPCTDLVKCVGNVNRTVNRVLTCARHNYCALVYVTDIDMYGKVLPSTKRHLDICHVCEKKGGNKACSICHSVWYCSLGCKLSDDIRHQPQCLRMNQ